MHKRIATATVDEFTEFQDVVIRIASTRGSFPVHVVEDGKLKTAEQIGQHILDGFKHNLIESEIFAAVYNPVMTWERP
jgi:hypothetical protein